MNLETIYIPMTHMQTYFKFQINLNKTNNLVTWLMSTEFHFWTVTAKAVAFLKCNWTHHQQAVQSIPWKVSFIFQSH